MLPYLHVFGRAVPMYGVMTVCGVLLAMLYLKLSEPGRRTIPADLELSCVWGAVGCFIGAKALYLLTALPDIAAAWPLLSARPGLFIKTYLLGGFVFYGGLYGFLLAVWIYCRASRADFYGVMTRILPAVPLVHGFGRLGCFCTGCCYGVECEGFGVAFTASEIAPNGVKLLPVQLIEAAGVFALFALLLHMAARRKGGRAMLGVYLLAYSILRFALEFFRGDTWRGFVLGLSVSQLIALLSIIPAAALLARKTRRT